VDAVRSTLVALGRKVLDGDIAATPTTGVLVRNLKAAGGIQISASHNPHEYNGIKLFGPDGRVITAAAGEEVLERFHESNFSWVSVEELGSIVEIKDTTEEHLRRIMETISPHRVRGKELNVVLDSNNGAGSILGRKLLQTLGCEMTIVGGTPNGRFEHPPEPTADNLESICERVKMVAADVGFCQDPDADRLALIDETGRYVGEEYTVAICLKHVLQSRQGPVVTNCSSSRMSEDIARKQGVPFYRSKVGEANVTTMMQKHDAVFGGEGNGGPIDPRVGFVRDSFVGMALILDAMAGRNKKLSELVDELPRYEIHKTKVQLEPARFAAATERLKLHFADAKADLLDGLRLDWSDKWLLVRASNTEPIVRVIAEANSQDEARRLSEEACQLMISS
jgi:phosphomannomutase